MWLDGHDEDVVLKLDDDEDDADNNISEDFDGAYLVYMSPIIPDSDDSTPLHSSGGNDDEVPAT